MHGQPTVQIVGKVVLLMASLFHPAAAGAQKSPVPMDSLMQRAMTEFHVLGAAVAVVKDGETLVAKGYGLNHALAFSPEVDGETLFGIASLTKAFTSTAIALLVQEGKLDWNDPVRMHIPEFAMYSEEVGAQFTLTDLLTHRSGLPLGAGDLMLYPQGGDFEMADVLKAFQYFEAETPFRSEFAYNNLLYLIAGEAVARVSGMPFETFVEKRIMAPLGMQTSSTRLRDALARGDVALPHNHDGAKWNPIPFANASTERMNSAAGGFFSNVDEMAIWMNAWLSAYQNLPTHPDVIDSALLAEAWHIHTPFPTAQDSESPYLPEGYGKGWVIGKTHSRFSVWHSGGKPGMVCKIWLVPEAHTGVVVLTNQGDGGQYLFEAVSRSLMDAFFSEKKTDWVAYFRGQADSRRATVDKALNSIWSRVDTAAVPPEACAKYAGTYTDPWFGSVVVNCGSDTMGISSERSPLLSGRMYPLSADTFAVRWTYRDMDADVYAIFSEAEEGIYEAVALRGISPLIDFSFDFHHLVLRRPKEE